MKERNIHLGTGAYALNALPEDERRDFARHLRDCDSCADEVAGFTEAAARLGTAATAVRPPEALRDRVLRAIRTTRQDPPPPTGPGWTARLTRRLPRLALAASLALTAASGGIAWWQYDEARDARSRADRAESDQESGLARVLTAPDARTATAVVSRGGSATVVVSALRNQAVLVTADLPVPPPGRVYQIWYTRIGHAESAGLIDPARQSATVLLEPRVDNAAAIAITVEPQGGSPQPTTTPVTRIALTR